MAETKGNEDTQKKPIVQDIITEEMDIPYSIKENLDKIIQVFKDIELKLENKEILSSYAQKIIINACEQFYQELNNAIAKNPHKEVEIGLYALNISFPYFMLSRLNHRSYTKPRGYAGDFGTMEIAYENIPQGTGYLGKFIDEWVLNLRSAQAVRNRIKIITTTIMEELRFWDKQEPMPITSLASGPSRELIHLFKQDPDSNVFITNIDIDSEAIKYATTITRDQGITEQIRFIRENIIKIILGERQLRIPQQQLMYACGLIDYFTDELVLALINWMHNNLLPGGRILLGQIHKDCPDKPYLDHILDWKLIYRSETEIKELFSASKFQKNPVKIKFEDSGTQMFCSAFK